MTTMSMAPDEHVHDLQRLLARVGLGDQQRVGVDAELLGVVRVQRVLGVDERRDAAGLLRVGHGVQRHGGLAAALRAVDLDDAAARQAAEAQRHVQRDRAGRDYLDRDPGLLAEAHDRALAELPLDLEEGNLQGLIPVASPLRARLAAHCHGDSLPGLGACGHLPHRPGRLSFGPAGHPPAGNDGHSTRGH
jgi:hypothetical protein